MKRHKGFTLLELLIVAGMIAMLAALMIPALSRAKDLVKRTKCANNLHSLGVALMGAANENTGGRLPNVSTGQNAWNKIGMSKTAGNDPTGVQDGTRPLFGLMYRTRRTVAGDWVRETVDLVKPDVFLCPAVAGKNSRVDLAEWVSGVNEQVGFDSSASIHYAYQHSINPGVSPVVTMADDAKRVIMADRSPLVNYPGTKTNYAGGEPDADSYDVLTTSTAADDDNSPNHGGEGQNLLRKGGDVRWATEVVFDGDNIWLANDPDTGLPVANRLDTAANFDTTTRVPEVFLVP